MDSDQKTWDKWQSWLDTVDNDVTQILIRRQIWQRYRQIWDGIPSDSQVKRYGSPFDTWIVDMYVTSQAIGTRRQSDRRSDVISIRRLFDEMANHHNIVLIFSKTPTSVEEIKQMIKQLENISNDIRIYTNKRIAHYDDAEMNYSATFGDLDRSIDHLGMLLQKLHLVLRNVGLDLEITEATNWPEIFKHPWIADID